MVDLNLAGVNLGNTVQAALTPVVDTIAVVRTGTVDQIANFLRGNPDQRGAVETALASSGRAGDLSAIVERVTAPVTTTVAGARDAVADVVRTVTQAVVSAGRAVDVRGSGAGEVAGRIGDAISQPGRGPVDGGRLLSSEVLRSAFVPASNGATGLRASVEGLTVSRGSEPVPAALREGRTADLPGSAAKERRVGGLAGVSVKEGRLVESSTETRAAGRLAVGAAAARSIDGVLAAFAAKGGMSATELALFARSGLLSESDVRALRGAGILLDVDDTAPLIAPRDGPAEDRIDTDAPAGDGMPLAGFADHALAHFDGGAIRIGSRAAFETYGVLGPPGSTVIPADAFEGVVRGSGGDLTVIERRLGLDAGTLADPDSFIALIDRRDLVGLRLAEAVAAWMPGGTLPSALADMTRSTRFREVTLAT